MITALLIAANLAGAVHSTDLSCRLTRSTLNGNSSDVSSIEAKVRIDGAKMRWCAGACLETFPLVADESTLWLSRDSDTPLGSQTDTINRRTGHRINTTNHRLFTSTLEMECRAEPFSGFPKRKF